MRFDLHMHTTRHSPDSQMDPVALVRTARQIGLDGVVITEHDWLWTEAELSELRKMEPGLVVLAGIVVGGTSILGGEGAVWRTVVGTLFIALIGNGFVLLGLNPLYEQITLGGILLIAVGADAWSRLRTR